MEMLIEVLMEGQSEVLIDTPLWIGWLTRLVSIYYVIERSIVPFGTLSGRFSYECFVEAPGDTEK